MVIFSTDVPTANETEYIRSTGSIRNKNRIHKMQYTWIVLKSLQAQPLIIWFNHLYRNEPVQMEAVNDVRSPFGDNINPGYPRELKLYLEITKDI